MCLPKVLKWCLGRWVDLQWCQLQLCFSPHQHWWVFWLPSTQGHPKHLAKLEEFPKARWSQTRGIHQQLQPISKPQEERSQDPFWKEHGKNRSSNKNVAADPRNFLDAAASPPILLQSSPSHGISWDGYFFSLQFLGSFTKTPYHHRRPGEEQAGQGRSSQCPCYFCMWLTRDCHGFHLLIQQLNYVMAWPRLIWNDLNSLT